MEKIGWTAKVSNSEVLSRVMEDRCIVNKVVICWRLSKLSNSCHTNVSTISTQSQLKFITNGSQMAKRRTRINRQIKQWKSMT